MTQHTPGPWHTSAGGVMLDWPEVRSHDHDLIARTYAANATADANFIASAPDLLAACKAALDTTRQSEGRSTPDVVDQIRAAIDKAEGRTP